MHMGSGPLMPLWITQTRLILPSMFRKKQVDQGLDEEIQHHLGREIDEGLDRGLTPEAWPSRAPICSM